MSETVADGDSRPAVPKDASTVILVRDSANGPEVFLQRRVQAMAFAAGMTVFPGGGVDPTDAQAEIGWSGPGPAWWGERFAVAPERAQALVCAAVRETFEECGVLLAGPTADTVVSDTAAYRAAREQLERRELSLGEFLARERLVLRADLLRPWANWITPLVEPRRYDTRFFVAVLPDGQRADGATSEAHEVAWRTPAQALDRWRAGLDVLLPPTWSQLIALGEFASTAAILAAAPPLDPIQPDPIVVDGAKRLQFPNYTRYLAELPDGSRLRGSQ
ncbi:NUDIX hydrolase [Nocardia terpenica]|uniref:NUDIX hydrolase n=1 Tax=Nocardia terpenica TaxID=455432 RepID=UPI001892F14F|nr:NUDIX hydrolase [Nocardia terpenica]MBF6063944.1 NUDIX hydrolase [Nocardia terpenica]MBF6107820.1 NUDIX hydrolase [Nocardia terpenica]MBF6114888.1 NUDIX hydrolase [Nocardia terpenica]MBF6121125.1 NUDIX hydrolase [Nocardia terpenica]MBF6153333.1 NUDIX hydrolase [Nocardia terpenica]